MWNRLEADIREYRYAIGGLLCGDASCVPCILSSGHYYRPALSGLRAQPVGMVFPDRTVFQILLPASSGCFLAAAIGVVLHKPLCGGETGYEGMDAGFDDSLYCHAASVWLPDGNSVSGTAAHVLYGAQSAGTCDTRLPTARSYFFPVVWIKILCYTG